MVKTYPFIAYHTSIGTPPELVTAPIQREWMTKTRDGFANRCLPLLIANQAGWFVLSPHTLEATWNGTNDIDGIAIKHIDGPEPHLAATHFGYGILTFTIPFLFRTPPNWNLQVRGPTNMPKDGISPLDGIIETDWASATFTMNWQITRPNTPITFTKGEPIAMLMPQHRGDLETFAPTIRGLYEDPAVAKSYAAWRESRNKFITDLPVEGTDANEMEWQKDYVHGRAPDGTVAKTHQRKLSLRPFRKTEPKKPEPPKKK